MNNLFENRVLRKAFGHEKLVLPLYCSGFDQDPSPLQVCPTRVVRLFDRVPAELLVTVSET